MKFISRDTPAFPIKICNGFSDVKDPSFIYLHQLAEKTDLKLLHIRQKLFLDVFSNSLQEHNGLIWLTKKILDAISSTEIMPTLLTRVVSGIFFGNRS